MNGASINFRLSAFGIEPLYAAGFGDGDTRGPILGRRVHDQVVRSVVALPTLMGHARWRGRVKFQARRDLPKHFICQLLQAGNPLNRKLVGPMAGAAI